jgi:hypothetical protein
METMKNYSILLCPLFLFAFSCEQEKIICTGEAISISYEPMVADSLENDCRLQNIGDTREVGSQVNVLIQSQADYEKYMLCATSLPDIDFSQKTLLAGRYVASHMDQVKHQRVYQECNGKVKFEVRLDKGGYTAVTDVFFFAVVPKISSQAEVIFDVSY